MTKENRPREGRLQIKKYPNRRYYDATHSRHLTLEEIQGLIQRGYDIQVVDAKTSTDITAQVLTQIILELDTPKLDSLPVPLLVRLIRMNDQLVKDFIDKYFNRALQSFLDYQKRVEDQIRSTHGLSQTLPTVTAWTKAMLEPFASVLGTGPLPRSSEADEPSPPNSASLAKSVRKLQQEVASLKRTRRRQKRVGRQR